jgi:AraC-like DNA-binding protein
MKLYIKNMVSFSCKMAVRTILEQMNIRYKSIELGEVEIDSPLSPPEHEQLKWCLRAYELELLEDRRSALIEKVKNVVTELIYHSDSEMKMNYSDYLREKVHHDYTYLSSLFSSSQGITIEKYIIVTKIERVKQLLSYGELNLSQIACKMQYSSVGHLSNQFKKVTGVSPTQYKQQLANPAPTLAQNEMMEVDTTSWNFSQQASSSLEVTFRR